MDAWAMLVPASITFTVGIVYTLFRQQLKDRLKRIEKARLQKDLDSMHETMERTKTYIQNWRHHAGGRHAQKGNSDTDTSNTDVIVIELEEELGQMLETMQEVEADLEDLYNEAATGEGRQGSPGQNEECGDIEAQKKQRSMTH